jgi:hypothetical protein
MWEQLGNNNTQIRAKTGYHDKDKGKANQQDREFQRVCKTSIRGFESHPRLQTQTQEGKNSGSTGSLTVQPRGSVSARR